MKKILLSVLVALFTLPAFAQQANVVFFSEFGEEFTVFINGQKQNSEPAANVRIEDVKQEFFQIRVDFKDPVNAGFQANVGSEKGTELTYMVRKNKKGVFVARVHNSSPIGSEPAVAITPAPAPATTPTGRPAEQTTTIRVEEPVQTTQTIQTTTTITETPDEAVDFKMEVPGGAIKINIDGGGIGIDIKETTSTTVTTTTTTTGTTRPAAQTTIVEQPVAPAPAPVVTGGCAAPVSQATINQMKTAINDKSFEDSKMTIAKQATRGKCLNALQVKEIMGLFSFEESKLEYAKYAYDFTFDQDNYYLVNDAFTFESSIDDLNQFIERR